MALRTIRVQGDPVLEKICKPVKELTPRTKELIEDMLDTMYEANGVGLAAPQVGILKRIVVIDVGEGPVVMVNPVISDTRRRSLCFMTSHSTRSPVRRSPSSAPRVPVRRPSRT